LLDVVRIEAPDDVPARDEATIDIALLDMNCGYANVGHDAIVEIVRDATRELAADLDARHLRVRVLSYAVRDKHMVPDHAARRHRLYLGTGGPGHLDPRRNTAHRGTQEIAEDPGWEPALWALFDAVDADERAALYGVCHTFGLICRWSGVAEPALRGPEKGGPMSGVGTNVMTPEGLDHPWFARMAAYAPGVAVPVLDSRHYDLLPSGSMRAGATPIAFESAVADGAPGEALTMLEIAREPDGTPRFFAVNSHPEIAEADRVAALLERMLAEGTIDRAVYEQRVAILPVLRDDRSGHRLWVGRVVFADLVRDRLTRIVRDVPPNAPSNAQD
jgi:hypothetical protein